MSLNEKISKLEAFIRKNPALADVPFMVVGGRPITPREALRMLREGTGVAEVLSGLSRLGIDPPQEEEMWRLAEAFWQRIAAASPERPKIYALGAYVPAMTPAEALEHIRRRDEVGRQLVSMYASMLKFMSERMALM